jgi:transglutaminase-like putative cysteine protease
MAVLPHALHLPIWISALFVSVIGARIILQGYQSHAWMRLLIAVLALSSGLGVYLQYGSLLGRDAGIALLVIAAGFKLLESYRLRDAVILVFVVYFLVVTNFLYTQSIPMSLYMLGVVAVTTVLLIRLNQNGESPGWRERLLLTGTMLLRSAPFMIALFLLFPRINGPLWSLGAGGVGVSGLNNEMSPGDITRLVRSAQAVFRVTFDGAPPAKALLYWRGPVLSEFDGQTWRAYERRARVPEVSHGDTIVAYNVSIEPHDKAWLFALDLATAAPPGAYFNADYQLIARESVNERRRYRISSTTEYTLGRSLSAQERSRYLALPRSPSPRITELVGKWRAIDEDAQDFANRALAYYHEQPFVYSLTPPRLVGDRIDRFLFETRKGFCGHYAGSFVVLMRTAGIPARVVTGYQGGEWNPLGGYMLIRQSDAHAWAEIWIDDRGWVRVDPTAAVSPARVELGFGNAPGISDALPMFTGMAYSVRWINRLILAWDTLSFHWHEWVVAYGPQRQQDLLGTFGIDDRGWRPLVVMMGMIMLAIVLLYAIIFIWRNRMPRPLPVLRIYSKFRHKMTAAGLEQYAHEGAVDYARRVTEQRPELADEVERIAELYSELRYGVSRREEGLNELRRRVQSLSV